MPVLAQGPGPGDGGFTWDDIPGTTGTKKFPRATGLGNLVEIEAQGHFIPTANVMACYLTVQRCIKGQPGVPDPSVVLETFDGTIPIPPGATGYWLNCTPKKDQLTMVWDRNYSYIVQFLVDVDYSPNGPNLPKVPLSPNAVLTP
jgi:hypothetical protein